MAETYNIKIVKPFSYNQNSVPWGIALIPGVYTCMKVYNFLNA